MAVRMRVLFGAISRLPPANEFSPTLKAHVAALVPFVEAIANADQSDVVAQLMLSRTYREIGETAKALEIALAANQAMPGKLTAVFVAGAYRAQGDIDSAAIYFKQALAADPEDDSIMIDLGDMLCANSNYDEGLAYYQRAVDLETRTRMGGALSAFLSVDADTR